MGLRENILIQIEQFLETKNLSVVHVCFFMQSLRILIEIDQSSSKYKIINHYCNWLLHKELVRSNSPVIIEEIANSFNTYSSKNDLIEKINEAVSLKKLILEIKEILWLNLPNKKVVSRIDCEEYWISFLQTMLKQLCFRPIKLKKDNLNLTNFEFSIYGLQIVGEKEYFNIELLSK